ncbi:MAG: ABC transporter ATP-binding protein/permease [Planctomycetaceae bacterium]|jgi:ATP-binding cassette subfamily B protein/subfamily B ATP-binding cassette protein MsbA|nr:ABC transporter ATP-binding protein/permease [Planctomycetaceae bacterium]
MKNLFRAISQTFQFKWSIIASVFLAVSIGVLWGGNIAVIYPFVEVTFDGKNMSDWLEEQLKKNQAGLDEIRQELTAFELTKDDSPSVLRKIRTLAAKRNDMEKTVRWLRFAQPYVDDYTPRDPFNTVILLVSFVLTGTLLKSIFTVLHSLLVARISGLGVLKLRNRFYQKILTMEPNFFNSRGISDCTSRFTGDIGSLGGGMGVIYGKMIREPIKMLACLVGAALISWQLLLLTLVLAPIAAFFIRWLAKSIKRNVRKSLEQVVHIFARMDETIRSIKIVRVFGAGRSEYAKFRRVNKDLFFKGLKITKYDALTNPVTETMGIMMICLAVLAGAHLVLHTPAHLLGLPLSASPMSLGLLLVFFGLLAGAADPARKLSDIFTQFQSASAAADRVYEIIDRVPLIRDGENPQKLPRHCKSIEIQHVSFAYQPEKPVLNDVSLRISFGETVAIVGPSGCGKSTLLNLIPRFADPITGNIFIDGLELRSIRMRDLYKQISIVSQEPVLFHDTVYNNIRYGSPFATEKDVVEAARKANAHDFIMKELPDGYQSNVGAGGGLLSGGQRQRIALARAVLHDPAIFLLDEATSQIDIQSEQLIHEALTGFVGNRTTIIVTHRLSALSIADRIIVMNDGKIVDMGTHQELLKTSPFYARMNQTEIDC